MRAINPVGKVKAARAKEPAQPILSPLFASIEICSGCGAIWLWVPSLCRKGNGRRQWFTSIIPKKRFYGKLRPHLKTYDVTPFQTSLQALSKAVKAKNKASYDVAFAAVEQRLADADARMKGKETNWPYFVTETVVETLRSAAEEYDEAVKGQRIRNVVEYQDARGFGKRKSCSGPLAMRCPRRVQALLKQSVPRWLI